MIVIFEKDEDVVALENTMHVMASAILNFLTNVISIKDLSQDELSIVESGNNHEIQQHHRNFTFAESIKDMLLLIFSGSAKITELKNCIIKITTNHCSKTVAIEHNNLIREEDIKKLELSIARVFFDYYTIQLPIAIKKRKENIQILKNAKNNTRSAFAIIRSNQNTKLPR